MRNFGTIIAVVAMLTGCQKEITAKMAEAAQSQTVTAVPSSDTVLFYDALVNGTREYAVAGQEGYTNYWAGAPGVNGVASGVFEQGIRSSHDSHGLTLLRGVVRYTSSDSTPFLKNQRNLAAFAPGPYSFSTDLEALPGVVLEWRDVYGTSWRSDRGAQANSLFVITQIHPASPDPTTGLVHGLWLDCIFSCRLYDYAGTGLAVENGRLRISVWL